MNRISYTIAIVLLLNFIHVSISIFDKFSHNMISEPLTPILSTQKYPFLRLSSGGHHSCYLTELSRSLKCWGSNSHHQTIPPASPDLKSHLQAVWAGYEHTCILSRLLDLHCWGANQAGQTDVPTLVQNKVSSVALGALHSCGANSEGMVECWGWCDLNQCAVDQELQGVATLLFSGSGHSCGVGKAASHNHQEQEGDQGQRNPEVKREQDGNPSYSYPVGRLQCWGLNLFAEADVPYIVTQNLVITGDAGESHTCALTSSHNVSCWGSNKFGQSQVFGQGFTKPLFQEAQTVSAGKQHTCMLNWREGVECRGDSTHGVNEVPAELRVGVKQLTSGQQFNCIIWESGSIKCWGEQKDGQTIVPSQVYEDEVG